jgi:hypothetical protein
MSWTPQGPPKLGPTWSYRSSGEAFRSVAASQRVSDLDQIRAWSSPPGREGAGILRSRYPRAQDIRAALSGVAKGGRDGADERA